MNTSNNLGVSISEIRELVCTARSYVAGEAHFSFVCNAVEVFREAARLLPPGNPVRKMSEDWAEMAVRVWPEMARVDNRISEEEFRKWVQAQLVVFEPAIINNDSHDA